MQVKSNSQHCVTEMHGTIEELTLQHKDRVLGALLLLLHDI
jgi:hypothetical protein